MAKAFSALFFQIDMLEYLGCESATLLLCGTEVMQLGSTKGTEFLDENFCVTNSFRNFFGKIFIVILACQPTFSQRSNWFCSFDSSEGESV